MKRGCLIVVILVPVVSLASAGVVFYRANQQYGLFPAEVISQEEFAQANTRLRATIRLADLQDFLKEVLPPETQLPAWMPFSLEEALPQVLPYQIALLGGANFRTSEYEFTLFVNEQRGGPFIAEIINQSNIFDELQVVKWDEKHLSFQRRGVLTVSGTLPMPEGMEDLVLERWTSEASKTPLTIEGGHLFEIALDNRDGEALTLWGTLTEANKQDFRKALAYPEAQSIVETLSHVSSLRIQADLVNPDALKLLFRIYAEPDTGPNLKFMLGAFVIPPIQQELSTKYDMKLDGDTQWDEKEGAVIGDFTLTGFHKPLMEAIHPPMKTKDEG
ncbi:MAG: hypothetical protein HYV26_05065 [Candidatus Hydrogenedentes bacterium]|nr:hypothetical protein [Candidatus Hydrogenedentota bacterium]